MKIYLDSKNKRCYYNLFISLNFIKKMNNIENFKLLYINVIKIYLLNFSEKKNKKMKNY